MAAAGAAAPPREELSMAAEVEAEAVSICPDSANVRVTEAAAPFPSKVQGRRLSEVYSA